MESLGRRREEEVGDVREDRAVETLLNTQLIRQFQSVSSTYLVIVRKFERFYIGILQTIRSKDVLLGF